MKIDQLFIIFPILLTSNILLVQGRNDRDFCQNKYNKCMVICHEYEPCEFNCGYKYIYCIEH